MVPDGRILQYECHCVRCIGNIYRWYEFALCCQAGGLPPLLELMASRNGNLQHNAAFALYGLADNEDNIAGIVREGGVDCLHACEQLVQVHLLFDYSKLRLEGYSSIASTCSRHIPGNAKTLISLVAGREKPGLSHLPWHCKSAFA